MNIQEHKSVSSTTQIVSNVDKSLKWNEEKNTRSKSTDAYGELEFKNSTGKRAKVVFYTIVLYKELVSQLNKIEQNYILT